MADFFEKVKGSLDKGIKTVSSKGKELIETTKLKGDIRDVEASIQSKFNALGKKVFEMLNKGGLSEEELKADCSEISSLYKGVTEIEEGIKKVTLESLSVRYGAEAVTCQKCGVANKPDDKLCNSCGSSIVQEITPEGNTCQACGNAVKEEAKFCTKCGEKLA